MKSIRFIAIALLTLAILAACAPQETQNPVSDQSLPYCPMPIYFDSEEDLLRTINEVKSKKNAEDAVVIIKSNKASDQRYYANSDDFKLASISEFYKPNGLLKGTSFEEILVKNEYVSYYYVNEDQIECATFTWFRDISPEVHMNELYGRGEISAREINYNGIKYVLREWPDTKTNKSAGFSIDWVVDEKCYSACVPTGYTDDEMLAFCHIETVYVK